MVSAPQPAAPATPATPAYTPSFTPSTGSPTASAAAGLSSVGQVDPSGLSDSLAQNQFNRLSSESGSTSPYFLGAVAGGTANTINNLSRQWSGTSATVAGYDAATSAKLTQEKQQSDAAAAAKQANQMVSEMQSGAIAADAANQKRLLQLQQQAGQIAKGYSQLLGSLNSGATGSGSRSNANLGYSGTTYRGDLNAGYDTQSQQAASRAQSLGYNLGESNYSKTYTYDPTIDNARNKALQVASSYLGTRYVLGGESHYAMDCSGLVQLVYQQLGYRVPTHSAADEGQTGGRSNGNGIPGVKVPWGSSMLQPGDLIAWKDGSHIAIYAGHGQIIESANTNVGTVRRTLWASPDAVVGIHLNL